MPETTLESLVRRIHAARGQLVLAATGGGSRAIGELLSVPGGSRTVLEAVVPYSAEALADFLHAGPEQFCSPRTARLMAMAAWQRAKVLRLAANKPQDAPAIGVGCTASLASDRTKRGEHRIHVAIQTAGFTATHSLELIKDRRSRSEEEQLAAAIVLNAVAEGFGLADRLPPALLEGEHIESLRTDAPQAWQGLLSGTIRIFQAPDIPDGSVPPKGRAVFSGAFNPLHTGHLKMAHVAAQRLGVRVDFEISVENVDKPPLDYTEMAFRGAQFSHRQLPLWFTRAPTFAEKSDLFPGATFIVGADTLLRIGHCRYYGHDPAVAEAAIARIAKNGCRFLVFGRLVDADFRSLHDIDLPASLRQLCDEIPSGEFREDISSTDLRSATDADT
jgi:nicotinamide mononucleotide (NMN) deamidase PncC